MLLKLLAARALSGTRQDVVAMLPTGPLAPAMRATGASVEQLDFLGGLPVLSGSRQLAMLARRLRPDVVQGWMYHGNLGAALAQWALGGSTPLVWGIRQSLPTLAGENAFARVGIRLNQLGSRRPDRLLFNSQASMKQHADHGFDMQKAQYIANGFDTQAYAPDPEARARSRLAWGLGADAVVYGLLARHHPAKGHDDFIQAAKHVGAVRDKAHFVMAGTGVDANNPALVRALKAAGLLGQVHLMGECKDVAAWLAGLDVCVSASTRIEAFSNAIGEAMSCAVPCIATDVGDSPQIIADSGRTVPAGNPEALARAMMELLDLGAIGRAALGRKARQRIADGFSLDAVASQYRKLYTELTHRGT